MSYAACHIVSVTGMLENILLIDQPLARQLEPLTNPYLRHHENKPNNKRAGACITPFLQPPRNRLRKDATQPRLSTHCSGCNHEYLSETRSICLTLGYCSCLGRGVVVSPSIYRADEGLPNVSEYVVFRSHRVPPLLLLG